MLTMSSSTNSWRLNPKTFAILLIWNPQEVDLFADRFNTQLEKYISWKLDPFALITDAFLANWGGVKAYAFSPFCLIQRCIEKVRKIGGIGHCDTSMANTTLLSNVTEHVNCRLHSSTFCPGGGEHPLITNGTLTFVVWKISGETKECMANQQIL